MMKYTSPPFTLRTMSRCGSLDLDFGGRTRDKSLLDVLGRTGRVGREPVRSNVAVLFHYPACNGMQRMSLSF
jgi:hypothetical protein